MRYSYVPAILAATLLLGCASAPPRPTFTGAYEEPSLSAKEVAYVGGTLTERLLDASRVRLEGIDDRGIAPGPRIPAPIRVLPGVRRLSIICEASLGTGQAWITLVANLQPGHSYVLRCEEQSPLANVGTDFRIEDESDSRKVIAKGSSWGPSSSPRGRVF